ncbi:Type 1 glutamine amidotransferase-like domain-containing protein [Clostridium sp. D2Q-11]|uniref:Type 1 glutamine amidotransferase-like domain-containing protein n=1 Tax=Anaeromonas frigoriresistens TaxID=2683708 RepID=A0A942UT67_9FIRM|nr:Type 1 glutamine amidotransferase-like domain-containing protein [Anaeromonas frigoriresistens]MBS4538769.1 Type 1 glutamine amidotransferase-like domain-containing protein [Anaeromonas frigoriresistens]
MLNYGITNIKKIDLYDDWSIASECKVIYIARGNTYKLLDIVKRSRFSEFLVKQHSNKIIIGNSASAIILGRKELIT